YVMLRLNVTWFTLQQITCLKDLENGLRTNIFDAAAMETVLKTRNIKQHVADRASRITGTFG
ncbi:MAG: hypothetical protein ACLUNV_10255, partial [Sutterella wadsworthensis]